ncbi:MAG: GGDEF domain-containing protein [Clostridiales bacterium]|nr:GGDEF domain-containing protein [Clostridiales bacterium]
MKMLEEVEGADEGSAVLFIRWLEDIEGESLVPQRVLEEVIELSPVPVYGTLKHYIGTGIVGGYLYDITLLAQDVANLAIAFIDGIDPNDARELLNDYSAYVFDARALRSWHIDKDSLPSDSVIEFKAKNVWNEYKAYIIIVLTIISLEFLLIIALIRNYKKRIRAEINLLKMNASLEKKVAMRTQELKSTIAKLEELNRELEYMSGIDPLTKLYNRRNMEELLNDARSAYIRTGNVFSVMMLDIDDFKKVNDKYGHFAGDQVLEVLANLLKESVRRYDKVARWGGEEFLLLFPGLKKESALSRAEAIRKKIEEAVCRYDCHEIPITVTIGVATIQNNETIEEVIARADESLYVGKNTGKNKVVAIPK